jgi:hypothetical protein
VLVASPFRSVELFGRDVVRDLVDRSRNSAPGCCAVVTAGGGELNRTDGAFLERFVAVVLERQVGGAPDIDLRYHTEKIASLRSKSA